MKLTRYTRWTVLALALVNGFYAGAQSNGVPGPTAYSAFSGFITQRNIFDPNRYQRNSRPIPPFRSRQRLVAVPTFRLAGTMSYEKGMFAFFDGNLSDLRKVLSESGQIAGYTVAEIAPTGVKLQTADKRQTVEMKIGEIIQQERNTWQPPVQGDLPVGAVEGTVTVGEGSNPDAGSTPGSASEPNDVLRRLMQQREQELK